MPGNWSNEENDLIVADYFAMLDKSVAGEDYSIDEHREALAPYLDKRSKKSIEFKRMNISAVLEILDKEYIPGYPPLPNIQKKLVDAVARWMMHKPDSFDRTQKTIPTHNAGTLTVEPAPTILNSPLSKKLKKEINLISQVARKFDIAGRDERNRTLGKAGEKLIFAYEQLSLEKAGRGDLAKEVRWVSDLDGDGAGYDIASFEQDGSPRLIEVKTTNGRERMPFYISKNEIEVSESRSKEWCLFRLWNFSKEPKAFELRPPLKAHVELIATTYQVRFPAE